MTKPTEEALVRLRTGDPVARAGIDGTGLGAELAEAGVGFAAVGGPLEARWHQALAELAQCIRPLDDSAPVLNEGGVYAGSWIESTGTINAEVLARFAPGIARDTHLLFAERQRDDGMIPYKLTDAGPGYSQIQIVTPLARTVWHHHRLTGGDRAFLEAMYRAMARYDDWLARYRDTRGTGGVEAFCTFDTGHDLSPRFWFAPDRAFRGDARHCDPDSPILPYVAPDLTANVACQRTYLALIAEALGEDGDPWRRKARASTEALEAQCFDQTDGTFYDRDRTGSHVRVQSDVLLRVLACEVGDEAFFSRALRSYVMNTRKFLSHYGFTSLALDDPRFDADASRNSWGGPVNFLALLRAPQAFEHHGHVAELAVATAPVLGAMAVADRFPQCLDPWSGAPGFTSVYSPSILWLLDAVERGFGIVPRPDGEVWFTGLPPTRLDHGAAAEATAYARRLGGRRYELAADDERVEVHRDGSLRYAFPRGWRIVTDAAGNVQAVVGMSPATVTGELEIHGRSTETLRLTLSVAANERIELDPRGRVDGSSAVGFVPPTTGG
ncbi:MGH1-like glycoside hydrolase domain-containing protein [Glycomyces tarimensis]